MSTENTAATMCPDRHLRHHGGPRGGAGRRAGAEYALCRCGRHRQADPQRAGGLHITLEDALKLSKQLKDSYDGDPQVRKLIDTARAIEGMPRNTSTHAAGVVITNGRWWTMCPGDQ